MPYVNMKITREGATPDQKAELIAGVTELLARVLGKNPATTVVVIEEVDEEPAWVHLVGLAGLLFVSVQVIWQGAFFAAASVFSGARLRAPRWAMFRVIFIFLRASNRGQVALNCILFNLNNK